MKPQPRKLPSILTSRSLSVAIEGINIADGSDVVSRNLGTSVQTKFMRRVKDIFTFKPVVVANMGTITKKAAAIANRGRYLNLSDITVFTVPGVQVPMYDYLDRLAIIGNLSNTLVNDAILPTHNFISQLINNPAMLQAKTMNSSSTVYGTLLNVDIKTIGLEFGTVFSEPATDKIRFGTAFRSLKDMVDVCGRVYGLLEIAYATPPATVEKRIEELFKQVNKLVRSIKQDAAYASVSKEMAEELGARLHAVAEATELYAVYHQQLLLVSTALGDSVLKIEKLVK